VKRRGFSLIETVLGMAAGSFLLAALLPFAQNLLWLKEQAAAQQELQYEIDFVMNTITNDLRVAESIFLGEDLISVRVPEQTKPVQYLFHHKSAAKRIMKDGQPMTGESDIAAIDFTEFHVEMLSDRLVLLRLTAENRRYKQQFSLETAVTATNIGR